MAGWGTSIRTAMAPTVYRNESRLVGFIEDSRKFTAFLVSAHDLPKTLASGSTVTNRGLIESWSPVFTIYISFMPRKVTYVGYPSYGRSGSKLGFLFPWKSTPRFISSVTRRCFRRLNNLLTSIIIKVICWYFTLIVSVVSLKWNFQTKGMKNFKKCIGTILSNRCAAIQLPR